MLTDAAATSRAWHKQGSTAWPRRICTASMELSTEPSSKHPLSLSSREEGSSSHPQRYLIHMSSTWKVLVPFCHAFLSCRNGCQQLYCLCLSPPRLWVLWLTSKYQVFLYSSNKRRLVCLLLFLWNGNNKLRNRRWAVWYYPKYTHDLI